MPRNEKIAPANGIEIAYEEFGDEGGEPLLLVMGLATQMIHWDARFCDMLVDRGFRVIRFDNRDMGHSSKITAEGRPTAAGMMLGTGKPAYKLRDMAADTVGLLDHLGLDSVHIVGASMGGMISQTVAIGYPERVRSLTSIMSTTGNRRFGLPKMKAFGTLLAKAPNDREAYADRVVKTFATIGSPGYPFDEERVRDLARAAYDRRFNPGGVIRQLHGITSSGDRTKRLGELRMPALVIHGKSDPLVRTAAGRATARAIPGSHLKLISGMGHDLPEALWPEFATAITSNADRAGSRSPAAA